MKKFKTMVYFHRSKEDNWEICDEAKELGFKNPHDLVYLGYELEMEVEVSEDLKHKVLKIDGQDVTDKEIYL